MKILIVGANGQLGVDMLRIARAAGHEATPCDLPDFDITREASIRSCLECEQPEVIINCAAYTAVDACEMDREHATAVNATGAGLLARQTHAFHARLIHFSTDYVFDGKSARPYLEDDPPCPTSVYGETKLAGERQVAAECPNHLTLRIAWLYGLHGANFVKAIRKQIEARMRDADPRARPLHVVHDQIGSPTYTADVCDQTLALLKSRLRGTVHATSEGQCTWYEFAQEIARAAQAPVSITPCTTDEFPRPARRPASSVLENARLKQHELNRMPDWRAGFERFLEDERAAGTSATSPS